MSKYTFVQKLASGGYGSVSKVEKNGKFYADKEYIHDIDLNELDLLRRLNHPNIISCKDFFKLEDKYHVILELADGPLYQVNFSAIDKDTKLLWCYQLASAIHFIHSQGYTHCDLKPQNILVKDGDLKVADLGLTFPIESESACGTSLWNSFEIIYPKFSKDDPEVVSFFKRMKIPPINRMSSDIFGLGLLFAFILTGKGLLSQYYQQFQSSPLKLELSYMEYISKYPSNIEDLGLDENWTDLLVEMCDPMNTTRIKTISEILNYPIFTSRSLNQPISGKILKINDNICVFDKSRNKTSTAIFSWISNTIISLLRHRSPFLILYVSIDLYYRLSTLSISRNNTHIYLYAILCLYISLKLLTNYKNINPAMMVQMGQGKFDEKLLMHYYDKSLIELKGVFRSPTLYDKAVSKRECIFGLFCMLNCELNNSMSINELHDNYINYEGEDVMTRQSKFDDTSSHGMDIFSQENLERFNSHSTEVFQKLGPAIIYRGTVEKRYIPDAMLENRMDEYNQIHPDHEITIQQLQELVLSL